MRRRRGRGGAEEGNGEEELESGVRGDDVETEEGAEEGRSFATSEESESEDEAAFSSSQDEEAFFGTVLEQDSTHSEESGSSQDSTSNSRSNSPSSAADKRSSSGEEAGYALSGGRLRRQGLSDGESLKTASAEGAAAGERPSRALSTTEKKTPSSATASAAAPCEQQSPPRTRTWRLSQKGLSSADPSRPQRRDTRQRLAQRSATLAPPPSASQQQSRRGGASSSSTNSRGVGQRAAPNRREAQRPSSAEEAAEEEAENSLRAARPRRSPQEEETAASESGAARRGRSLPSYEIQLFVKGAPVHPDQSIIEALGLHAGVLALPLLRATAGSRLFVGGGADRHLQRLLRGGDRLWELLLSASLLSGTGGPGAASASTTRPSRCFSAVFSSDDLEAVSAALSDAAAGQQQPAADESAASPNSRALGGDQSSLSQGQQRQPQDSEGDWRAASASARPRGADEGPWGNADGRLCADETQPERMREEFSTPSLSLDWLGRFFASAPAESQTPLNSRPGGRWASTAAFRGSSAASKVESLWRSTAHEVEFAVLAPEEGEDAADGGGVHLAEEGSSSSLCFCRNCASEAMRLRLGRTSPVVCSVVHPALSSEALLSHVRKQLRPPALPRRLSGAKGVPSPSARSRSESLEELVSWCASQARQEAAEALSYLQGNKDVWLRSDPWLLAASDEAGALLYELPFPTKREDAAPEAAAQGAALPSVFEGDSEAAAPLVGLLLLLYHLVQRLATVHAFAVVVAASASPGERESGENFEGSERERALDLAASGVFAAAQGFGGVAVGSKGQAASEGPSAATQEATGRVARETRGPGSGGGAFAAFPSCASLSAKAARVLADPVAAATSASGSPFWFWRLAVACPFLFSLHQRLLLVLQQRLGALRGLQTFKARLKEAVEMLLGGGHRRAGGGGAGSGGPLSVLLTGEPEASLTRLQLLQRLAPALNATGGGLSAASPNAREADWSSVIDSVRGVWPGLSRHASLGRPVAMSLKVAAAKRQLQLRLCFSLLRRPCRWQGQRFDFFVRD